MSLTELRNHCFFVGESPENGEIISQSDMIAHLNPDKKLAIMEYHPDSRVRGLLSQAWHENLILALQEFFRQAEESQMDPKERARMLGEMGLPFDLHFKLLSQDRFATAGKQ